MLKQRYNVVAIVGAAFLVMLVLTGCEEPALNRSPSAPTGPPDALKPNEPRGSDSGWTRLADTQWMEANIPSGLATEGDSYNLFAVTGPYWAISMVHKDVKEKRYNHSAVPGLAFLPRILLSSDGQNWRLSPPLHCPDTYASSITRPPRRLNPGDTLEPDERAYPVSQMGLSAAHLDIASSDDTIYISVADGAQRSVVRVYGDPPVVDLDACDYSFRHGFPYQSPYVVDGLLLHIAQHVAYIPTVGLIYDVYDERSDVSILGYMFLNEGAYSFRDMSDFSDFIGRLFGPMIDTKHHPYNLWNGTYFAVINPLEFEGGRRVLRTKNGEDWEIHVAGGECMSEDGWSLQAATATRDKFLAVFTNSYRSGKGIRICESSDSVLWTVVAESTLAEFDESTGHFWDPGIRMAATDDGSEIVFTLHDRNNTILIHVRDRERWIVDPWTAVGRVEDIEYGAGVFVVTAISKDAEDVPRPQVFFHSSE